MPKLNQQGIVHVVLLVLLLVGVAIGVYVVQHPTNILPFANEFSQNSSSSTISKLEEKVGQIEDDYLPDQAIKFLKTYDLKVYQDLQRKGLISDDQVSIQPDPRDPKASIVTLQPGLVTTCGQITSPGSYNLASDIIGGADVFGNCIVINNTSNVTFDCQGHTIGEGQISSTPPYSVNQAIGLDRVNNFIVRGCTLDTNQPIISSNGSQGKILSNNIKRGVVSISSETNDEIAGNTFGAVFQMFSSSQVNFHDNNMTLQPTNGKLFATAVIASGGGSNNTFEHNYIDGRWNGVVATSPENFVGADDGILLADENGSKVINNTILNNWDCGFETKSHVSSLNITGNTIKNSGVCGIGGWWANSWIDSTVSNNIIDGAPTMFWFYRQDVLHSYEDGVYFQDNVFTQNKFTNPISGWIESKVSSNFNFGHSSLNSLNISQSQVHVGNNVFLNNDFGTKLDAPNINPASLMKDIGGSICGYISSPQEGYVQPLSCGKLRADGNNDGRVDILDYGVWKQNFGQTGCGTTGDYNIDCRVDILDYGVWKQYFGSSAPSPVPVGDLNPRNISPSPQASPTTPPAGTNPSTQTPTNVRIARNECDQGAPWVSLTWDPVSDPNVVAYYVYYYNSDTGNYKPNPYTDPYLSEDDAGGYVLATFNRSGSNKYYIYPNNSTENGWRGYMPNRSNAYYYVSVRSYNTVTKKLSPSLDARNQAIGFWTQDCK